MYSIALRMRIMHARTLLLATAYMGALDQLHRVAC